MTAVLAPARISAGHRPLDVRDILKLGEEGSLREVIRLRLLIRTALATRRVDLGTESAIREIIDHPAYCFNVSAHIGACRVVGINPYHLTSTNTATPTVIAA